MFSSMKFAAIQTIHFPFADCSFYFANVLDRLFIGNE